MEVRFLKNVNSEKFYPVGHAGATYLSDGRTVEEALKDSSGKGVEKVTKAEYDALPPDDKKDILFVVENPDTTLDLVFNGTILGGVGLLNGYVTDDELTAHINNPIHIDLTERIYWNSKADGDAFDEHINNTDIHITADERADWNSKQPGNSALDKISENDGILYYDGVEVCVTMTDEDAGWASEEACYNSIFASLNW